MQMSEQQRLPVPLAAAWEALNDTQLLTRCIPGCESLTLDGEDEYAALMVIAIGPVKARFKGRLCIEEKQPPTAYRLQFEGQGGAAGHGKGHANVRLEAEGPDATVLHYEAHATVGGKLAQIGSRLVDMAARKLANDFFARFNAALQESGTALQAAPAAQEPVTQEPADAPGPSAWQRAKSWLG